MAYADLISCRTAISELLEANGVTTIPTCTYKFPYTDVTSFVELANKVTTVGIGVYMGAIKVSSPATVLTVIRAH